MATNPYEVEHNIKAPASGPHRRRPDMSTFMSHLHQISRDTPSDDSTNTGHNHPPPHHHHAGPTPVDTAALFRLLQDQLGTLAADTPDPENRNFLLSLMQLVEADIESPPDAIRGVSQQYLDALDRVPRKALGKDDSCPLCIDRYLDDPYWIVVELPCQGKHRFDLECVGPWLRSKGTCPMCRADLTQKRVIEVPKDEEEEQDDVDGLYG
ncbi:hypothetical protein F4779DRAFT_617806 [Xylariaceae sp. FL0662B]|nr:hypothetical protein F4779DRAFT_617806 [Xylariaceae sp. FL0662B]